MSTGANSLLSSKERRPFEVSNVFAYIALMFAVYLVCSQQKIEGLYMDDLSGWIGFRESENFWNYIWGTSAFKFRPVSGLFMGIGFALAGANTKILWFWLVAVNYLVAVIIFRVFKAVIKDALLAFLGTLVYVLSRFAYYSAGQYHGVMELSATLMSVLVLYYVLVAVEAVRPGKHIVLAAVFSLLATFAHERYMSLPVLVILAALLTKTPIKKKVIYSAIAAAVLVFILVLRKVMFSNNAWAGTGGSDMVAGLNIKQVIKFFISGCLYQLGINVGPAYLAGFDYYEVPSWVYTLNVVSWCVILICIVRAIINKKLFRNWKKYFLIVAFIGATLIVSCTTIRLELRWMYTPYVGTMLLWIMLLKDGEISKPGIKRLLPAIMIICMIVVELFFHTGFERIYFWKIQGKYNQLYQEAVVNQGYQLEGKKITVVGYEDSMQKFFEAYAAANGQSAPELTIYHSFDDFVYTGEEDLIILFGSKVTNLTTEIPILSEKFSPAGNHIRTAKDLNGFYGWEGAHQDYIWMGQTASMRISTGSGGTVRLAGMTPAYNIPDEIRIYFNDTLVYTGELQTENFEIHFDVPVNTTGQLRIELNHAYVPAEVGGGDDRRQIGICIFDLFAN